MSLASLNASFRREAERALDEHMDISIAESWMREALVEARKAQDEGEVPVGAVLLLDGKIVGRGHNSPIQLNDPTAHAEIMAIRHAARMNQNYRLPGSTLIVTVEPCIMCLGALIQTRVDEVIFGADDPKAGAIRSRFQTDTWPELNHTFRVTSGILQAECSAVMKAFFASRR